MFVSGVKRSFLLSFLSATSIILRHRCLTLLFVVLVRSQGLRAVRNFVRPSYGARRAVLTSGGVWLGSGSAGVALLSEGVLFPGGGYGYLLVSLLIVCMFSTADLEIKNVPNPLRRYHLSAICPEDI